MARPKRVSVQGKGADLFFGDLQAPEPVPEQPGDEQGMPVEAPTPQALEQTNPSTPPDERSEQAQASKHASNGADGSEQNELISSVILDAIWRDLAEQATVTNAFRYTHEELGQLTDAIYELGKEHGTRVTKQEVARLGLNAILTDYQIRGADSLLSTFIARRSSLER